MPAASDREQYFTQWVKKSPALMAEGVDKYPKMGYSIDTQRVLPAGGSPNGEREVIARLEAWRLLLFIIHHLENQENDSQNDRTELK